MNSFSNKLAECGKAKNPSQKELAHIFCNSNTTIGKYEYDEMIPSIADSKKLAKVLDTTESYLRGENEQANLFKDTKILQRFQDIANLPDKERESLITTIDHVIKATKINLM